MMVGGAGNGSIGLYAVAIARALGAERVDYLDQDQGRLELAVQTGAMVREGPPPPSTAIYFSLETPLPLLDIYSTSEITFKTGRVQARPAMPAFFNWCRRTGCIPNW